MRGHRDVAPHARSTFANLLHEPRGRRAVLVVLARDVAVRRAERLAIQLMAGKAIAPLDQPPPLINGVAVRRILQILRVHSHASRRDLAAAQRAIFAIRHAHRVAHRHTREEEGLIAADEIDGSTRRLIARDNFDRGRTGRRALGVRHRQRCRVRPGTSKCERRVRLGQPTQHGAGLPRDRPLVAQRVLVEIHGAR